jgi:hypothetical protein
MDDSSTIKFVLSVNGDIWAEAVFPSGFVLPEMGYTLLDASDGNIFLQALTNRDLGFGRLFRSNWNGTFFSYSLDNVNDDMRGHVDFEKLSGLKGVILANQLENSMELQNGGSKALKTKISYDDGHSWGTLKPPLRDSKGVEYKCTEGCSLHLHAFTERRDKRDTYSSPTSAGLMLGVGNVGEYLTDYNDGRTFMSRDAGFTWIELIDDAYMYEIADSGAIVILTNDETSSDTIKYHLQLDNFRYSINYGDDIQDLQISDKIGGGLLRATNIITEPSGTTSHLIVIGVIKGGTQDQKTALLHLDFSNVWSRDCALNDDNVKNDFEKWSFMNGTCQFGRKVL